MQYAELFSKHKTLMKQLTNANSRLAKLPDGYISEKNISGKVYPYLQKRTRGKMQSQYIKAEQLQGVRKALSSRGALEKDIASLSQEIEALEQAAVLLDSALYRRMLQSKRSMQMDVLPVSIRMKSLSFSRAMLSLEGVDPTTDAKSNLQAWGEGKKSFSEGYRIVLQKYNLTGGDSL